MNTNLPVQRLGAACGLVASFLIATGIVVSDMNDDVWITDSSSEIASTFIENQTAIFVGTYLMLLGVFFFISFIGYLRMYLVTHKNQNNWLVSVSFGGGLVACAMLLLAAHFSQALTIIDNYGGDTQVAKALYALEFNWYLLVEAPALAVFVGATVYIGFTDKALPAWLNVWGAFLTLALLSPVLPGFGVMVTFLWVAALSVQLLIRTRSHAPQVL